MRHPSSVGIAGRTRAAEAVDVLARFSLGARNLVGQLHFHRRCAMTYRRQHYESFKRFQKQRQQISAEFQQFEIRNSSENIFIEILLTWIFDSFTNGPERSILKVVRRRFNAQKYVFDQSKILRKIFLS